ncbi:MAG TPA: hypothetical protein VMZ52_07865 [Bryobacteraceae bacterium]|nr:hypothetical protein [Bryobacteraceae bacterium]
MRKKHAPFKTEAQEAEWWAKNQDLIADRFERAKAAGTVGTGTIERIARERASQAGASPTITIRLPENDLTRARTFAAKKGLRYQTYLKMLLHEALNSEEKKAGSR